MSKKCLLFEQVFKQDHNFLCYFLYFKQRIGSMCEFGLCGGVAWVKYGGEG